MFPKRSLEEGEPSLLTKSEDAKKEEDMILDLSQGKPLLAMPPIYFLVQMLIQMVFLVIFFHEQ